jgi:hypothetical protein
MALGMPEQRGLRVTVPAKVFEANTLETRQATIQLCERGWQSVLMMRKI